MALISAIWANDYYSINKLINSDLSPIGSDIVNQQNEFGTTPLIFAIREPNWHMPIIRMLLNHISIDVNITDANQYNVLHYLMKHRDNSDYTREIYHLLIKKGININQQSSDGYTPLMIGLIYGLCNAEIIKDLIDRQKDFNLIDKHHRNLLHHAIGFDFSKEQIEFCRMLLERGVNINACDDLGNTALSYFINTPALHGHHIYPIAPSLWQGPDFAPRDIELVELLLSYNVNTFIKNTSDSTAYDYAQANMYNNVITAINRQRWRLAIEAMLKGNYYFTVLPRDIREYIMLFGDQ